MGRAFICILTVIFTTSAPAWAFESNRAKAEPGSSTRQVSDGVARTTSVCVEPSIVLTYPDATQKFFQSYEQAYEALVDEVGKKSDGRIVVSLGSRQVVISKTKDTVTIEDGDQVSQKSVEDYLALLLEARDEARRATCAINVQTIQQAVLLWSQDHDRETLQSLNQLAPYYLQSIPCCPFTGTDTYSEAFLAKSETRLQCSSKTCRRD